MNAQIQDKRTGNQEIELVARGYFLPQELCITHPEDRPWRKVSGSIQEIKPYLNYLKGRVDGVEFIPFIHRDEAVGTAVELAKYLKEYPFDIWYAPRLYKQIDIFPTPPSKYIGYIMLPDGTLSPGHRDVRRRPVIDYMNPEAMNWFLDVHYEQVLKHFQKADVINGFFWPEEHLGANMAPYPTLFGADMTPIPQGQGPGYFYGSRPCYSEACLRLWQDYCKKNNITHNGKRVDKFPVHLKDLVSHGKGKTQYFPGYNRPKGAGRGSRFIDWPRNRSIWKHWDIFVCETYLKNFLLPFSRQAHEILGKKNGKKDGWRGVLYFGSSPWLLPYEKFSDPAAHVCAWGGLDGAWGYQCGIDLEMLAKAPEITYILHEFRGLVSEGLNQRHELFLKLIRNKEHGVLLHDTTAQGHLFPEEEREYWNFIKRYQPGIISMYSTTAFQHFPEAEQQLFYNRLRSYQETGDPFSREKGG